MKPFITSHLNRVLTLILTIIALVMGQNTWADNGWDIQTNTSGNVTTFTITRTNTAVAETVRYRLVNLSAYAMQHYYVSADLTVPVMNLRGEFTFTAGETKSRTITVTEQTANNDAYLYQTGTERSYKLEVTDIGGFLLAEKTRSFKTGTNISDNIFRIRDITIQSDEYKNTDAGYENNDVKSVASSSYFDWCRAAYDTNYGCQGTK